MHPATPRTLDFVSLSAGTGALDGRRDAAAHRPPAITDHGDPATCNCILCVAYRQAYRRAYLTVARTQARTRP